MIDSSTSKPLRRVFGFWGVLVLLLLIFGVLFFKVIEPQTIVFSNDAPLGVNQSGPASLPGAFSGWWVDLNWLGFDIPAAPVSLTDLFKLLLGPVVFAKLYPVLALLFTGLMSWLFWRGIKLSPEAALLGALAVALNSTFFSTAAWGLGVHTIAIGWTFAAFAALADTSGRWGWIRVILAGACVGAAILEGFDVGAILSLLVAAFVLFQALQQPGSLTVRAGKGLGQTALVAGFAALISAQALLTLVGTQIQGVAGMEQDAESKARRWDEATQWSLPKREVLSVMIPGLFGYRLDTPQGLSEPLQPSLAGGNYWGSMGRQASWEPYFESGGRAEPGVGFIRHTGGGPYAGVLVVLLAVWGVLQSFRKTGSPFTELQKRWIWFWAGTAGISLLLAFGRHAPFYQLLYQLPFFSTIRNPVKFNHTFSIALTVLFAYGVHGLCRVGREARTPAARGFQGWWSRVSTFDRRWIYGCLAVWVLSLVGWRIYAGQQPALESYLTLGQFDAGLAAQIARFSIRQVGFFILLFTLSAGSAFLVWSGVFAGRRALWGVLLLGLVLGFDLGRANRPWIIFWDYQQKYATNPILDKLREQPYEQRVAVLPFGVPDELALFDQLYKIEWVQHLFQYYDIQSLDLIQLPRQPVDYVAFESALAFRNTPETAHLLTRRWELTNTRFLLGPGGFLEVLNNQLDPQRQRFRIAALFDVRPKAGVSRATRLDQLTAVPNQEGPYALIEFTGALPRAQLFADWQVQTNDTAVLAKLTRADFDPHAQVLVSSEIPPPQVADSTNAVGSVTFQSYRPKHIVLQAQAERAAVLLLNDRYDSDWRVRVDGQPAPLLRANFLMRGVYLEPGKHTVEFRFEPPRGGLYLSLATMSVALLLLGVWLVSNARAPSSSEPPPAPTNAKARSGGREKSRKA